MHSDQVQMRSRSSKGLGRKNINRRWKLGNTREGREWRVEGWWRDNDCRSPFDGQHFPKLAKGPSPSHNPSRARRTCCWPSFLPTLPRWSISLPSSWNVSFRHADRISLVRPLSSLLFHDYRHLAAPLTAAPQDINRATDRIRVDGKFTSHFSASSTLQEP